MKASRLAAVSAAILSLSACDSLMSEDVRVSHLSKVRSVHLQTNDCPAGISKGLREHGFAVVEQDQKADAELVVNVIRTGRNLDDVPQFGGFGAKAQFQVEVIGKDDKALFTTAGDEGSLTSKELCEDIGDEIAEKMKGSVLGTVN